jgi:hypothetical protein
MPICSRGRLGSSIAQVVIWRESLRAAAAVAMWLCTANGALAQTQSRRPDYVAVVEEICRRYAAAQHALPYETMYAQCMFARGLRVPGFSPSPNSPGYQGELSGPAAHNGGF